MNIKQQIEFDLGKLFGSLGYDPKLAVISVSSIDICDYQCNAVFALAKALKKAPIEVAKTIASGFKSQSAVCEAVAPGFLNFKVTDNKLIETANEVIKKSKLPLANTEPRTIFFDYGGANIAKELHVGHLRSPIIGEALKRVFQSFGHKVISDVYLGDWGLQNGLVIAELIEQGFVKDGKFVKTVTLEVLNQVYPSASKKKTADPEFKAKADEITLKVQQKAEPFYTLWKQIREISVAKIRENYGKLNCSFDFYNGESDAQPYVSVVINALKKKKLAYESDNCLIMDVVEDSDTGPMPPIILQKHNGGDLYATNDVATIYYRVKDFKPNEFIYITDARQELHFKQVFRCVRKGGFVPNETKLTHIGYGTMNGADGKPFKTRDGGTIRFEDVTNLVTEAASKRLIESGRFDAESLEQNSNKELPGKYQNLASKIGLAALKFADLSNNVRKDYIFDVEKFTSFEGKTGPYILYTIARINSIFRKAETKHDYKLVCGIVNNTKGSSIIVSTAPLSSSLSVIMRDVLVKVLKLADSYLAATSNYTLNGLVDAGYALAVAFNGFYAETNILKEADPAKQKDYLALCKVVKIALENAMNTLAIDVVEEM